MTDKDSFDFVKDSIEPDKINDYIVKVGKNLAKDNLSNLLYLWNHSPKELLDDILMNLIWALGEYGEKFSLSKPIIKDIINYYFTSDRWIREEILIALVKISSNNDLPDDVQKILEFSLQDDYPSIH
ncbi:MAG: hypothetical protein EU544_00150, partial [Promethearchaeota archaeon]